MSEEQTIRGETMMTWRDQARFLMRSLLRYMAIISITTAGMLVIVWAITAPDRERALLFRAPLSALALAALSAWPFFLITVGLVLALMIGWHAWAFHRLPRLNRSLRYEATRHALVTRDAADLAFTVPWSAVVRVRNSEYAMRMKLAAGVWRTIYWRAFAPEDRQQIVRWARPPGDSSPPN